MSHSELAARNRSVSGQDRKFPPAPGTNQIAGFREFRPLTSQEKNNSNYCHECVWRRLANELMTRIKTCLGPNWEIGMRPDFNFMLFYTTEQNEN